MKERINRRKEYQLLLLRLLYEATDGDESAGTSYYALYRKAENAGIPGEEIKTTFEWLCGEGFAKRINADGVGITHDGVNAVEDAEAPHEPQIAEFARPPSVHHVQQQFYGPVGTVQTGSHNTATVVQHVSDAGELLRYLTQLRQQAQKLPDETRNEAIQLVEVLEDEAKSEKPKKALAKHTAEGLKSLLPMAVPIIQMIVELFLKK